MDMLLCWIYLILRIELSYSGGLEDPAKRLVALQSQTISMVCSVSSPEEQDELQLVFWLKEGEETPLFIYDLRKNRSRVRNMKYTLDGVRYKRFYFSDSKDYVSLTVTDVTLEDEGLYRCRIDFRKAPTRISSFVLSVTVPPEKLTLRNSRGLEVSRTVGPYNEGDNVTLFCEAIGGTPPPKLSWLKNGNALIDEESNGTLVDLVNDVYIVRNLITVRNLKRKDAGTNATCVARSGSIDSHISTASVKIVLNLPPLNASISLPGREATLSASFHHDVTCTVIGSQPSVNVTWSLADIQLRPSDETVSEDGNVLTSRLRIKPRISDDGNQLTCRASNPSLLDTEVQSSVTISVSYKPLASISLGLSLHPNEIKEGDDVYFECKLKAYPKVTKLVWRHDGKLLQHNPANRLILSNQSLVLQQVDRMSRGNYSCHALNSEGEGHSQPFMLSVKHRPYCISNESAIYGLAIGESLNIGCRVISSPQGNIIYKWKFNNSHEVSVFPDNRVFVNESGSFVVYRVLDEFDYGVLICDARNEVGDIADPCKYLITPAGQPSAPKLCNATKIHAESLQIECIEGFDGGLTQVFVLEAYSENGNLVANMTGTEPKFLLRLLEPGHTYELNMWAGNAKGRSDLVRILAAPPRTRESGRSIVFAAESVMQVSPIIGSLIGGIGGLIVLTIGVAISIHVRRRRSSEHGEETSDIGNGNFTGTEGGKRVNSPDLITGSNYVEGKCQCPPGISFIEPGRVTWSDPLLLGQGKLASKGGLMMHPLMPGRHILETFGNPHEQNQGSFGFAVPHVRNSKVRIDMEQILPDGMDKEESSV